MDLFELVAKITLDSSEYERNVSKASSSFGKMGNKIKKGLSVIMKASATALAAAGVTAGKVLFESVQQYSEFEQMVGGVRKLYGNMGMTLEEYAKDQGKTTGAVKAEWIKLEEAQNLVLKNSREAYKTAGMSANEYMRTATSFSASLITSLDGDTVEAARLTDVAMRAISDNWNTFGGDMGMISGAFQGFAKQNYMMLDNLKLGYGGTKTEMQRLIKDANEYAKTQGKAADLTISKFSDIVEAIELIQEKQHIAGTTEREAQTTIQGSLNMTKKAWENLQTGLSDPDADVGKLVDGVVESAVFAAENIFPTVERALTSLSTSLAKAAPKLGQEAVKLTGNVLPELVSAAVDMLESVVDTLISNADMLIDAGISIVKTLVAGIGRMAPTLLQGAFTIISELAIGLGQALPVLLPEVANIISQLLITLTSPNNVMMLVNGAIVLVQGLADGFFKARGVLIQALPAILQNVVNAIIQAAPQMMIAATELMVQLTTGFIEQIPLILNELPQIIKIIAQGLIDQFPMLLEAGKGMAKSLWDGFKGLFSDGKKGADVSEAVSFDAVGKKAQTAASTITDAFSTVGQNPIDVSAATGTATTQIQAFADAATQASSTVSTTFSTMGTEISNSISSATSSGTDWSAVVSSAQSAATSIKAAWKAVPADFRNMVKKIQDAFVSLPTYVQEKFTTAASYAVSAWSNVPAEFAAIWQLIKYQFRTSEAYQWGLDMMNNFTRGVHEGRDALIKELTAIAQESKDILGHSTPKKGPMKDDDLWTVHMMDNFISGIESKRGELQTALSTTYTAPTYFSSATRADALEAKVDRLVTAIETYLPQMAESQVVLDSGALVGGVLPAIDRGLGRRYAYAERGNA